MGRIQLRNRWGVMIPLILGISIGWGLWGARPNVVQAGSSDRSGESIMISGPVLLQQGLKKSESPVEALYFLDYRSAKLLATIPEFKATGKASTIIGGFAERDLMTDFKLQPGVAPKFLMNTALLGGYSDGEAALFVNETTTRQLAAYKLKSAIRGVDSKPEFELLQVKPYGQLPPLPAPN